MIGRREVLLSLLGTNLRAAAVRPFRLAICSETFPGAGFREICVAARETGYTGLEIDPSNLSGDPASLSPAARKDLARTMAQEQVAYVGLHSFLKSPAGLHVTAPDAAVRARSWEYFDRLIDLAADLGARPVMVLGSSKQRQAIDGMPPAEAVKRLEEGLARVAPHAEQRGVTILMEPLAPHLCNVVNTMEEAVTIVRRIGSPAVQSMFDTHNTAAEKLPHPELIRRHFDHIRHVHLNEMDGRYPGSGDFPFVAVLRTLRELRYSGWLSVEVFDFKPDGRTVAKRASEHLRRIESELR